MPNKHDHPTDLYDQNGLAKKIHHSPRTLERWRMTGDGPPYVKLGRKCLYQLSAVEEWLAARTIAHAGDASLDRREPGCAWTARRGLLRTVLVTRAVAFIASPSRNHHAYLCPVSQTRARSVSVGVHAAVCVDVVDPGELPAFAEAQSALRLASRRDDPATGRRFGASRRSTKFSTRRRTCRMLSWQGAWTDAGRANAPAISNAGSGARSCTSRMTSPRRVYASRRVRPLRPARRRSRELRAQIAWLIAARRRADAARHRLPGAATAEAACTDAAGPRYADARHRAAPDDGDGRAFDADADECRFEPLTRRVSWRSAPS